MGRVCAWLAGDRDEHWPSLGKQAEAVSLGLVLGAPEQAMLGLAALQLGLSWGSLCWAEFEGALGFASLGPK